MEPPQNKKTMSPQCSYYYRNRAAILEKEREKKRWLKYYAENKDAVRERRLKTESAEKN